MPGLISEFLAEDVRQLDEYEKCRLDPVYFISTYLHIYETRAAYGIGFKPFTLWPRQVEYVHFLEKCYHGHTPGLCEKCRDMGATLVTLAWIFWHWLFDKDFVALLGSIKVEEVKLVDGHDSLMAKLRDFLETMPEWLLPKGFNQERDLMSLSLVNPESNNTIRGAHCTEKFGRSRRASVALVDEYGFWEFDVSGNLEFTTDCAIYVSTVNGMNQMYDMRQQFEPIGQLFEFNWDASANHTPEWFTKKKKGTPPAVFAREVLRDYRSSVEGQLYPGITEIMERRLGDFDYRSDWPLICFWDYGLSDATYIGFLQKDPDTQDLYLIDEVVGAGHPIEWYVPFIPNKIVTSEPYRHDTDDTEKIMRHREWRGRIMHVGDPTGNQRTVAQGKSVFDILRPYDIHIRCGPGWQDMPRRQQATTLCLQRLFVNNERCPYFLDSFAQFVYPKQSPNSQTTARQTKGVHRWSHAPSAFEAFAITEDRLLVTDRLPSRQVTYTDLWAIRR